MPDYLPASSFTTDRKALPKDPVNVAADFIGAVYKHALSVIASSGVKEYFELCQKEFVLSVPAVWSDKAMDLTLKVMTYPAYLCITSMLTIDELF